MISFVVDVVDYLRRWMLVRRMRRHIERRTGVRL